DDHGVDAAFLRRQRCAQPCSPSADNDERHLGVEFLAVNRDDRAHNVSIGPIQHRPQVAPAALSSCSRFGQWHREKNGGPPARAIFGPYLAAVSFHDCPGYREAEPCALPLRRVKGVEDLVEFVWSDTSR